MGELSLRERLQPALLDRLVDDERLLTIYELAVSREQLRRLGISERELVDIIAAQGLIFDGAETLPSPDPRDPERTQFKFHAATGRVGLARLKALQLKPPGAPQGIELQAICEIVARNVLNESAEPAERRYLSSRRLRESVCRDLAILLNSTSLEVSVDLSAAPHVKRSVLNYGMPSLAGRASASVDLHQIARTVETVIREFEPRLVHVRVTPETEQDADDSHEIQLRIDAQLWGQPAPQHLVLRTRICTDSGDVKVTDTGAG